MGTDAYCPVGISLIIIRLSTVQIQDTRWSKVDRARALAVTLLPLSYREMSTLVKIVSPSRGGIVRRHRSHNYGAVTTCSGYTLNKKCIRGDK